MKKMIAIITFIALSTMTHAGISSYNTTARDYAVGLSLAATNNVVYPINTASDLPTPADWGDGLGTVYHLEDGQYQIGNLITLDYPITWSTNADDTTILYGFRATGLSFTMTNSAAFVSSTSAPSATLSLESLFVTIPTNGTLFDVNVAQTIHMSGGEVSGGGDLGSIRDCTEAISITDSTFSSFSSGLVISNSPINYLRGIGMVASGALDDEAFLIIEGTSISTSISDLQAIPQTNDALFNISSGYSGIINLAGINMVTDYEGVAFSTNSIDQTDPRINSAHCSNIPDSRTAGGFYTRGNATISDYQIVGENLAFQSITNLGGGTLQVNSTDTGNLANDYTVWLLDGAYNGKYVIANVSEDTSFEITATWAGTATGEIQSGWIEIVGATTETPEVERSSMTATNTLTFTNIEPIILRAILTYSVKTDSATTSDIEICMMLNDKVIRESVKPRSLTSTEVEGVCQGFASVVAGDEIKTFTRNKTATTRNLIATTKTLTVF